MVKADLLIIVSITIGFFEIYEYMCDLVNRC